VTIGGYCLERGLNAGSQSLILIDGGQLFSASLDQGQGSNTVFRIEKDTVVEVTGVCVVSSQASASTTLPKALQIGWRTPADVVTVRRARGGTRAHLDRAGGDDRVRRLRPLLGGPAEAPRAPARPPPFATSCARASLKLAAEAASRAKSEFLAHMSHEVRTPLNGICGMNRAVAGQPVGEEQRSHLGMVKQSADSLLTIINDILDLAKIEAGKLSLDSSRFLLRETVDGRSPCWRSRRAGRAGIRVPLRRRRAQRRGDPVRLRQIFSTWWAMR